MRPNKKLFLIFLLCLSVSLPLVVPTNAQVRPINDYGALGLGQLLKRLNTTASVMMIGAHPDDEDSALLAYLARGESARTAYLSLTRGDGGQNIIGPELFEALGVIRTEELLQARRLDGAEQYFTRAYDFGFSKTLAEAKSKWPEDVIKCDVVRAIRLFRPLVVISRFTGTPADGHGQHQYAGYISPIAVKAAADSRQCTDAGTPWQVLKFYIEQTFRDTSEPTITINTGQYDPLLGRSYFEIAMEGRSQHRSQGEGRVELRGGQFSGLNLVNGNQNEKETSIFQNIDISTKRLAAAVIVARALREFDALRPKKSLSALLEGYSANAEQTMQLWEARGPFCDVGNPPPSAEDRKNDTENETLATNVALKDSELTRAILLSAGIQMDALTENETVVPGETLPATLRVFYPSTLDVKILDIDHSPPSVEPLSNPKSVNRRESPSLIAGLTVPIPSESSPTQPFWLVRPRKGDLFEIGVAGSSAVLPFEYLPFYSEVTLEIEGRGVTILLPIHYRYADPSRGEIRREVNIVPVLSVALDRKLVVSPISNKPQTKRIVVSVTNDSAKEQAGNVLLYLDDADWKTSAPTGSMFSLKTKGDKAAIPFDITIPANTKKGTVTIRASADVGGMKANLTMNVISYPHIQTHRYYTATDAILEVVDLKSVPAKMGYIMGSGDEMPEAIRQIGMNVAMLEEKDLASGDLSKFDTIVVGIRASETRPDMMANKQRLMDYVNNGGNLIMQYQRGNFAQSGLTPYPVTTDDKQGTTAGSVARVVDENAPVKILEPTNPIFNFPNKITDLDFKGWVQERNAYNLVTFDPKYTPLLESHDAGEQENKGGLVIAKVGKGNWIYCSYSFFRQLPAGVPGAYRLFANMLIQKAAH